MKRLLHLILCFALATYIAHGQEKADSLFQKAREYSSSRKPDSAIELFRLARIEYSKESNLTKALICDIYIADELTEKRQYNESISLLDSVISVSTKQNLEQGEVLFLAFRYRGRAQEFKGQLDFALQSYDSAMSHAYETDTERGQIRIAQLYRNIAIAHANNQNLVKAEGYFDQVRQIYDSLDLKTPQRALAYDNLGNLNNVLGRPSKAITFFNRAKEIYDEIGEDYNTYQIAFLYHNIGNSYRLLELPEASIEYMEESVRIMKELNRNSPYLPMALRNLGGSYAKIDAHDKQLEVSQEALRISLANYGKEHTETAQSYYYLGNAYGSIGQHRKAIDYQNTVIDIYKTLGGGGYNSVNLAFAIFQLGTSLYDLGEIDPGLEKMSEAVQLFTTTFNGLGYEPTQHANYLGNDFLEVNQLDSALKYFQEALKANSRTFDNSDYLINPKAGDAVHPYEQFISITGKAKALEAKYHQDNDQKWLHHAFDMTQSADSLTAALRELPLLLSDQLKTSELVSESATLTIRICHLLFELTGDKNYARTAFLSMEKNKASNILSNLNISENNQLDVPDSLLLEEKEFVSSLSYLETEIHKEKVEKQYRDSSKVDFLENELFKLRTKRESLIQHLKENYPSYFSVKYDHLYLGIKQVQDQIIDRNELLINYHLGDRNLYSIQIDKTGFRFYKSPIDSQFKNNLTDFLESLETPSTNDKDLQTFKNFSMGFLNVMIPEESRLETFERLTIIPDGILNLLPFEVLTKSHEGEINNFASLPYLIKDHSIRYGLSATLLGKQEELKRESGKTKVLAFAPVYNQENAQLPNTIDTVRSGLGILSYTQTEVKNISEYFETTTLLGKEATEAQFREKGTAYDVIHFASHGLLDEENPLFSKLVFSPYSVDSINDGFLNVREVLGLKIPAEMVVLSACNTGAGEVISGEGVQSISSGFFYAGAKSLALTLWTANDESTTLLMDSYYKNLEEGKPKSNALRLAKLSYLQNTDELGGHPYYWSHVIVSGNNQPIVRSSRLWVYILFVAIGMTIFIRSRMKTTHLTS